MLPVTRQVCYVQVYILLLHSILSLCSTGMIAMETFGKIVAQSRPKLYLNIESSYPYGTSQTSNTVVLIHDAFQPLSYWNGFMAPPSFDGVAMDTHIYQMFSVAVCPTLPRLLWLLTVFEFRRTK